MEGFQGFPSPGQNRRPISIEDSFKAHFQGSSLFVMEGTLQLRLPLIGRRRVAMDRFRIGDRVVVLPRFANVYPAGPGVVIEITLDKFRPVFNEYKIQFPDGSVAALFEFQIRKESE
jgi:hypothetical protein